MIGYREMHIVSQMVGYNWKMLTRRLFSYQDVILTENNIIMKCSKETTYESCWQMLCKWKNLSPKSSRSTLLQCLSDVGLDQIAQAIRKGRGNSYLDPI